MDISELVAIIAIFVAAIIWFNIGYQLGARKQSFSSYERGAWAIIQHHKYKGDYGSYLYRIESYKWGDPQNEQDVDDILEIVENKVTW